MKKEREEKKRFNMGFNGDARILFHLFHFCLVHCFAAEWKKSIFAKCCQTLNVAARIHIFLFVFFSTSFYSKYKICFKWLCLCDFFLSIPVCCTKGITFYFIFTRLNFHTESICPSIANCIILHPWLNDVGIFRLRFQITTIFDIW